MVYIWYNELVNEGFVMVYKPTYNWGAPSCMVMNENSMIHSTRLEYTLMGINDV